MSLADAPHRDPSRDADPSSSRDQRIEHLLLAGLDRYFAGELEHAIQVWSRVFFLDRGHPRARAYIERARAAIAEGQREAEARGHRADGAAAGDDEGVTGDVAVAPEGAAALETFSSRPSPIAPSPLPVMSSPLPPGAVVGNAVAARAPRDFEDLPAAPDPVTRPAVAARAGRSPTVAQALLVALAALLLFGAGYVVAARDRLAAWWAPAGEPALAVPAMAPDSGDAESGAPARAHETPAGSTTPPRGPASR